MRVSSDTALIDLQPGSTAEIALDVVNTGLVIDGITARVVGLPDHQVTSRPAVLPLFPESGGRLTLTLGVPPGFPAGRHPVTVEVRSRQADTVPAYLDVDLLVPSAPGLALSARPQVVRAHRNARYVLTVNNRGNTALDVALSAVDPERSIQVVLEPARLVVPAASAAEVVVSARGPRMLLGSEIDRPITINASAGILTAPPLRPAPALPADPLPDGAAGEADAEPEPEPIAVACPITLKQRPWLTRGLLTALILLSIIALWAAVFLFGLGKVFAGDPMTKSAPPSFFVQPVAGQVVATQVPLPTAVAVAAAGRTATMATPGVTAATTAATTPAAAVPGLPLAPPGALPKDGTLPAGLAGSISGVVVATSTGQPVGRILVAAIRRTSTGKPTTVSSAATQADGSYLVSGLFPGVYVLKFSATGFKDVYAPASETLDGAKKVTVVAGVPTDAGNAVITGDPATVKGTIDPGNTTKTVIATVTVEQLSGTAVGKTIGRPVKTNAKGAYTLRRLPAPATYQLTFRAKDYNPSVVRVTVDGGTKRLQPTVLLGAGAGSITGTVTDGTDPLGGITVSITVKGVERKIDTPTTGNVGTFQLTDLPTPATYVLTFSGKGYTAHAESIGLAPGEKKKPLTVPLAKGSGTVNGLLTDATGAGLGGATVTVGGANDLPATTTLTEGSVGSFTLVGLPDPGTYTVTFSLAGYADQTVPLTLPVTPGVAPLPTVALVRAGGTIRGTITDGKGPVVGATVVATDGVTTWPVTSTAASGGVAAGGYVIAGLPAGAYTVTATGLGGEGVTSLVTVVAGRDETVNFKVPKVATP